MGSSQPERHPYCVAEGVPGHVCSPSSTLARQGAYIIETTEGGKDADSTV